MTLSNDTVNVKSSLETHIMKSILKNQIKLENINKKSAGCSIIL